MHQDHEQQARAEQVRIWRGMSRADRYRCMVGLLEFARQCKRSRLAALHPQWTSHQIKQAVRDAFLYAHT